jgi:hypothetical protein
MKPPPGLGVVVSISARSVPVSNPDEFRRYAEECQQLVEDGDVSAHRASLETMAQAWRKLAVEEEHIADLAREVDTLFSTPSEALELAMARVGGGKSARRSH